ncbi:uncharacterized protein Taf3 [Eurosta solidaginis]|uniref:uncharacterized protein Taf3 n=1 Tax=Eurosta solidaginis TaxID=178769 RepID=UPI003530CB27
MSDKYLREILRICVAQICQTIGYNAIQTTPLDLLLDTLYKFLTEFTRDMRRQVEHYNRTEARINDVHLCLNNLNINILELLDYINNVEPVPCGVEVTKLSAQKHSSLNFLKPGSKEVLTRPVHIYEHLPPMLPPDSCKALPMDYMESKSSVSKLINISLSLEPPLKGGPHITGYENIPTTSNRAKRFFEAKDGLRTTEFTPICLKTAINLSNVNDEEGRPTREICSVVMTTGGFISPAIEGKVPDSMIPTCFGKLSGLDEPRPPTPNSNHIKEPVVTKDGSDTINTYPSQRSIMSASSVKPEITEDALKSSFLSPSKDTTSKQAYDAIKIDVSKKTLPSQQKPAVIPKVRNKVKRKITLNPQTSLIDKMILQEIKNPGVDIFRIDPTEKTHRKNKKNVQRIFNTGSTSVALSPDFCNSVFKRLKMEKIHKRQSKYEKKLLDKQNLATETKRQDSSVDRPFSDGVKLMADVLKPEIKNDVACAQGGLPSFPVLQGTEPIYLPNLDSTQISTPFSHTNLENNGLSTINCEKVPDNEQVSAQLCTAEAKREYPEMKLSAELDRNKLNIFKKISKQKLQKAPPSNKNIAGAPIYGSDAHINIPCGTTITPSPSTLNSLICSGETNLSNYVSIKDSGIVLNNSGSADGNNLEIKGTNEHFSGALPLICSSIQSSQYEDINKPKKRGRKPGSKNTPKVETINNLSKVSTLKKNKKIKSLKDTYALPLVTLKNTNALSTDLLSPHIGKNVLSQSELRQDIITSNFSEQGECSKKERKKSKTRKLPLTLGMNEKQLSKVDVVVPSKEEVNSINKKLMRMDTVLQPLGLLSETISRSDGITETRSVNALPSSKSVSGKIYPAPHLTLPRKTHTSITPGLPSNMFMPTAGIGELPSFLNFCPFPPRPGLIPPTAQNLLFPRLPTQFHLPISNFTKQYNAAKAVNQDSSVNVKQNDSGLHHLMERNYCNVPPFVPESMKLAPFETDTTNLITKDCLKNQKPIEVESPQCDVPLNFHEVQKQIEIVKLKSPKFIAQNALVGSTYFQSTSANKMLTPLTDSPMMNKNDPIELSDESVDFAPTALNTYNAHNLKEFDQVEIGSSAASFHNKKDVLNAVNYSQKDDHGFDLSFKDKKKVKKINKGVQNNKSLLQTQRSDLPQIDLMSTDKVGVSKLAGGADLIPLISIGSAYSSNTIPSSSLTATTATLSETDNAMSANLNNCGIFSIGTGIQRKKKEPKKIKKLKDVKVKKKKEKKSKNRDRFDCPEKLNKNDRLQVIKLKDSFPSGGDQLGIPDLKTIKRDKKKKYKQLLTPHTQKDIYPVIDSTDVSNNGRTTICLNSNTLSSIPSIPDVSGSMKSYVPKLTLKLGSGQSPPTLDDKIDKHSSSVSTMTTNESEKKRDPSPELARISPLVTRPLKQKFSIADPVNPPLSSQNLSSNHSASNSKNTSIENISAIIPPSTSNVQSIVPPPSPWQSGGTISASSVLLPQQLLQSTTSQEQMELGAKGIAVATCSSSVTARQSPVPIISEASRPSSYIDAEGNTVWICPACGKVDDGSPMIGCDKCDAWYHWICVGICIAPKDNEDWFCRVCITRKKGIHASDKNRRRHKKK